MMGGADYLALQYVARELSDVEIVGEIATALGGWSGATVAFGTPEDLGGGLLRYTIRATSPVTPGGAQQLRLKVTVQ